MAHLHSVYDTDLHFSINPETRLIVNQSGKVKLVQGDHNSERLTFEIPRYIDGHDMKTCNIVQVHYLNVDAGSPTTNVAGVYEVDDLQASPADESVVIFSWLISGNATSLVGTLNFCVRFVCDDGDGKPDYVWSTGTNTSIAVVATINNGEVIVEEYADVLVEWEARISALEQGGGGGADWNASEGEAGYVQNRTHYDEVVDNGCVLPETDLNSLVPNDDGSALVLDTEIKVFAGEQYNVYWNGRNYTTACVEIEESDVTAYVLGNVGALTGGDDTGEPFVVMTAQAFGTNIVPLELPTSNQIISIEGKTVVAHELPRRFLESHLRNVALSPIEYECTTNIVYTDSTTETHGQPGTNIYVNHKDLVRRGCIAKLVVMGRDVTLPLRFTSNTHNAEKVEVAAMEVFSFIHPSGTWMDVVLKMRVSNTFGVQFWLYPFNVTLNEPNDGAVLITFTIDGVEYQAEEGMTWGEWVGSKYDTMPHVLKDNDQCVWVSGNPYMSVYLNDYTRQVTADENIEAGYAYIHD